jgi:hypothetical protein
LQRLVGSFQTIAIIPQGVPTQLQFYQYNYNFNPGRWQGFSITITANQFADWRGMALDNPDLNKAERLLIYSSSVLVEVSVPKWMLLQEVNLDKLEGGFLANQMTRITSFGTIGNTFYLTRAGDDPSQPGQVRFVSFFPEF